MKTVNCWIKWHFRFPESPRAWHYFLIASWKGNKEMWEITFAITQTEREESEYAFSLSTLFFLWLLCSVEMPL